MMRRHGLLLAILVVAARCAPVTIVEPVRTRIGESYSVEPQVRWSSFRQTGRGALWTVDGPALQSLRFFSDVGDGQTLLGRAVAGPEGEAIGEQRQPYFRATMTPSEIMEVVVDTWSLLGASKIQATSLRPAKFGTADGFRFDLAFVWTDGVEARALVAGAVVRQRLQVIVYSGTRLHYFDEQRAAVDRLLESVRLE